MKDRINQFLQNEHLTPAEFADQIGVQRSSVSHVLNGRNNPSASFIQKMISAFPKLNTRWLLLGEGQMTISANNGVGGNLFSASTEPGIAPKQPEKAVMQETKIVEPNHVQINEPMSVRSEEQMKYGSEKPVQDIWDDGPGEIERIVVFYSDKTFKAYKPSK